MVVHAAAEEVAARMARGPTAAASRRSARERCLLKHRRAVGRRHRVLARRPRLRLRGRRLAGARRGRAPHRRPVRPRRRLTTAPGTLEPARADLLNVVHYGPMTGLPPSLDQHRRRPPDRPGAVHLGRHARDARAVQRRAARAAAAVHRAGRAAPPSSGPGRPSSAGRPGRCASGRRCSCACTTCC